MNKFSVNEISATDVNLFVYTEENTNTFWKTYNENYVEVF